MPDQNVLESGHQLILYDDVGGGISRATAPHKIDRSKWFDSLNIRFRAGRAEQIEPLAQLVQVSDDEDDTGHLLVITPVTINAIASTVVALTPKFLYSINAITLDTDRVNSADPFTEGLSWARWEYFTHETGFYFCNPANPVSRYTAVTGVDPLILTGTIYRAAYIENFYGHVVLGNVNDGADFWPNRLAWSDKDDFADFVPIPTNEADLFDIEQVYGTSSNGIGITGLKKLGNELFVYTANSIWGMAYVGLQAGVMQITSRIRDVGSYFPYGLAAVRDTHFFIGQDDFYKFDGVSVEPIGSDIRDYFFADVHPLLAFQNLTYSVVNINAQEITWYYCSKEGNGQIDKALVYNYAEQLFYPIDGRGVTCVVRAKTQTYKRIDDLAGTEINDLVGTIQGLSESNAFDVNLFGTYDTFVLREATVADPDENLIEENEPFLETGDIHRGTILGFKELESMGVDASYTHGTGIAVEVAQRDFLSLPIEFSRIGDWVPGKQEKRLSTPRSSGRVTRYRFTAAGAPPWFRTDNDGLAIMLMIEGGSDQFASANNFLNSVLADLNAMIAETRAKRIAALGFYTFTKNGNYYQPLSTQVDVVLSFLQAALDAYNINFGTPWGTHPYWFDAGAGPSNLIDAIVPAAESLSGELAVSCGSRHLAMYTYASGYCAPVEYTVDRAISALASTDINKLWLNSANFDWTGAVSPDFTQVGLTTGLGSFTVGSAEYGAWVDEQLAKRPRGFKFLGFEENIYKVLQER